MFYYATAIFKVSSENASMTFFFFFFTNVLAYLGGLVKPLIHR